jgi:L-aspartate oxidase
VKTDFLVIGTGIAGLSFALKAAKYGKITVLTKKSASDSNTNYAQGGIAAAIGEDDSPYLHFQDTVKTGCGLCDESAVKILVENGRSVIRELLSLGVMFDRDEDGKLLLSREAGHSRNRIVHVADVTGREIEKVLLSHVKRIRKAIDIHENCLGVDLIVRDGRCYGAQALDVKRRHMFNVYSKFTVLATGGIGQLYQKTSNPTVATGDGIAMAYRAGAAVKDMEFIQFHPTAFSKDGKAAFLLSETIRGEGGILRNKSGEAFMTSYDERGDLAPRDVVSRAVFTELEKGPVYLDIQHRGEAFIKKRFPHIYKRCLRHGVDITRDLIPVTPAAHYICGGIKTNNIGETDIEGLFAFGECACTGVHGANRLASNSLLESIVFSFRAEEKIVPYLEKSLQKVESKPDRRKIVRRSLKAREVKRELQELMWTHVGIVREMQKLEYALKRLNHLESETSKMGEKVVSHSLIELENMTTVARLITQAALNRKESVGTHYILR